MIVYQRPRSPTPPPMRHPPPQTIRLADYLPPDFLIDAVSLDIALHPTQTRVRSRLSLRRNPKGRADAPLTLNGDGLAAVSVKLDGRALRPDEYEISPDSLALAQPPQGPFTLDVETLIDPSGNSALSGLYRSDATYCTQCEAEGFRRITYFLDRPDVLSVYETRIEADKAEAPALLSNGNLIDAGELGDGRHYARWRDPFPKPSYLFALVGGDLAHIGQDYTTASGRRVRLSIYTEHGKETRAEYAMDALIRSMRWDERVFGREYDLDVFNIVAVSAFNMGAMENKGLNIFNDKYVLASPQTATDSDYAGVEAVIAHEYFHNWTGNRITCRDWFQLCLKEGLTVFRDQEFSSDERSRAVKRIADVRGLRLAQFPEDAGPLAHPVRPQTYREINNFYTATVYEKGAEIIRMLKTLIGADAFRRGMDIYFARYDGTAATIEDFLSCFAESSGRDLTHFALWYDQAGTPCVNVSTEFDAANETYRLTLAQQTPPTPGQTEKRPFLIPVALALFDEDGAKLALEADDASAQEECAQGLFELGAPSRTISFKNVGRAPALSLLRGFSAPVRVEPAPDAPQLLRLLAFDDDPFNRWQAAQSLALRTIFARVAALRGEAEIDATARAGDDFLEALSRFIAASDADPAFAALTLTLPTEIDLAREMAENVDPDVLFDARKSLRRDIGARLGPALHDVYARYTSDEPYSPDAASAGRRALRNVALDLIAAADRETGEKMAQRQFEAAANMTDRLAALATLALLGGPAREAAFAAFYKAFADDALVIDKWFSLQATIPEPGTTQAVRALMRHPDFSLASPNRTRALIGAFASANPTRFHALDGSGYEILSDVVLELDPKNPQVAARLLSSLRSWRSLEPRRRERAEAALKRILATPELSRDVNDIATRALA
jgi:aminopeptidase N